MNFATLIFIAVGLIWSSASPVSDTQKAFSCYRGRKLTSGVDSPVTYDGCTVTNPGMDIRSGFFKAPVSGIWSFTFSGGVKLKKNKGIKGKYGLEIVKNDDEMLGYLYKRSDSSRVSYGPVSMTVLVNLEVGDQVGVKVYKKTNADSYLSGSESGKLIKNVFTGMLLV